MSGLLMGAVMLSAMNANTLYEYCKSSDTARNLTCVSYILGASDSYASLTQAGAAPARVCMPEGSTRVQLRDVAVKYMEAHPEYRHFSAASQVILALMDAFPCEGSGAQ